MNRPNPKNRVDPEIESQVVKIALDNPALGQQRVSNELRKEGLFISPGGVRSVWQCHDLETFQKRLEALEAKVAQEGIILTESQLQALEKAKEEKQAAGEIETEHPGKENCMRIVNNKKFVTLNELATHLNSKKSEERFFYGVPELACAWADTRAKHYQATGKQVEEGVHYVTGDTPAEHLLSLEGCELIEKYATVDAHNVPVITDGAAELFS